MSSGPPRDFNTSANAYETLRHTMRGQRSSCNDATSEISTTKHRQSVLRQRHHRLPYEHNGAWHALRIVTHASGAVQRMTRSPTPCRCREDCMNKVLRRRLEMAVRVRDFLRAHKTDGAPDEPGLVRLEELLGRAGALAKQQRDGLVGVKSATQQRAEIKRVLESKLLRFLVAAGLVASREN